MSDVYAPQEPVATGEFDLLRREQVFGSGLANVIPLHRRGKHLPVEPIPDLESPIIEAGEPFEDEDGLAGNAWNVAVTGIRLARTAVRTVRETLYIKSSQEIHGFRGSEFFWSQMRDYREVTTSLGTDHKVRRILAEGADPQNAPVVWVFNPLGMRSDRGPVARIMHTFHKEGYEVWSGSTAGFEGKIPLGEVGKLSVRRQARQLTEVIQLGAEAYGVEVPTLNFYAPSKGGDEALGLLYRLLVHGDLPIGKVFVVDPCNGHSEHKLSTLWDLTKQFGFKEPPAFIHYISTHPDGPIKAATELAATVNLRPRAVMQVIASVYGLTMREGHSNLLEMAGAETILVPNKVRLVRMEQGIVRDTYPEEITQTVPGYHSDLLRDRYPQEAAVYFKEPV